MYDVVAEKFTFAISSPDEFWFLFCAHCVKWVTHTNTHTQRLTFNWLHFQIYSMF